MQNVSNPAVWHRKALKYFAEYLERSPESVAKNCPERTQMSAGVRGKAIGGHSVKISYAKHFVPLQSRISTE